MILLYGLGCVTLTALAIAAILMGYAPFGGRSSGRRLARMRASKHYVGGIFVNQVATSMHMPLRGFLSILRDQLTRDPARRPLRPLKPEQPDMEAYGTGNGPLLTWLGHSSFMARLAGQTILFDPVLSKRASPFQWAGPKRFDGTLPIGPSQLPAHIDAVVISHDHYDHLDYGTISAIASRTSRFFVPLGVGAHLERWGVQPTQIVELEWWDETTYNGVTFACTPSRHFSGRRLGDRFKTLWASWAVRSADASLYFSGDSGYGPHFKEVGERYGPFDYTMLECGQYDPRWQPIHMLPEETVAAHEDLRGNRLIPMHWGSFCLSFHPWTDSVERAAKAASNRQIPVVTPMIGHTFSLRDHTYHGDAWWVPYSK